MKEDIKFKGVFIHPTADVSDDAIIDRGTTIWNQAQVREHAQIGMKCNLGKDVYIDAEVKIGNNVKIQNGVSVCRGVEIEDDVFLGPHVSFTNDLFPRSWIVNFKLVQTLVKKGASIGANATIVCGITIGEYAMIGAGSVITQDVLPYTLVVGNPARITVFVGKSGQKLDELIVEKDNYVLLKNSASGEEQKIEKNLYYRIVKKKQAMIPLARPWFDERELKGVKESLDSGWVAGQGSKNKQLAKAVCDFTGTGFAIPVSNCTSGLHLALLALGIDSGDEVIVSDFTFPATGHAVMYCGGIPRFVDVDLETYNLQARLIEQKINNKTKAIIVVHALGQMTEMDTIREIANANRLFLIEDAASAFGASYKNVTAGKFGDISVFSFHARKNITSGEGGIVVTDNEAWAGKISSLSCFGMKSAFDRQEKFNIPSFNSLGYNYKLSDIQAAIVLEQIWKYPQLLERKRSLAYLYNKHLSGDSLIHVPVEKAGCFHVYQTYAVVLDKKTDRDKVILTMREDGIQTQIGTYALHVQPVYQSTDHCPNSLFLSNQTLALPLFYDLTETQIAFIANRLKYHVNHKANLR